MTEPQSNRDAATDAKMQFARWRRRVKKSFQRVWALLVRLFRLPFDAVLLGIHAAFIPLWKLSGYRRRFKRSCQCFISGDGRSFCALSYWYGSPQLVRLLCGEINTRERSATGHCRCRSRQGVTPQYPLRSSSMLLVTCLAASGLVWGGLWASPRIQRRLRTRATNVADLQKLPEILQEGHDLFNQGNYLEAATRFRRVASLDPNNADAFLWLGRCAESLKRPWDALKAFQRAVEIDPALTQAHVRLAWLSLMTDRAEDARRHAQLAVAQKDGEAMGHAVLALCDLGQKDYPPAREHAAKALRADPKLPLARYVSATLSATDGKPEEAMKTFESLLGDPDVGQQAGLSLADLHVQKRDVAAAEGVLRKLAENTNSFIPQLGLVRLYLASGQRAKGLEEGRAFIKLFQGEQRAVERLADVLLQFDQRDEALSLAMQQLGSYPDSLPLQLAAANVYLRYGLFQMARKHCDEALKLNAKNVAGLMLLGRIHLQQGAPAAAVAAFREVVTQAPPSAEAHFMLAQALAQDGKHAEAVEAYGKTIALAPDMAPAHFALAQTLAEMKKWKESKESAETALKLQPNLPDAAVHLGSMYYRLGDKAKAKEQFDRVLKNMPGHPASAAAANNLAWVLVEEGSDFPTALRLASQAVAVSKGHPPYVDTLGWARFKAGDPKGARAALELAVAARPTQAGFRYHYAVVLSVLGEKQEAIEQFKKALELGLEPGDDADARKRIQQLQAAERPK